MKLKQLFNRHQVSRGAGAGRRHHRPCTIPRKAVPGCAFVCLRGANADGHKYAKMAAEKGAAVIIAEEIVEAPVPVIFNG